MTFLADTNVLGELAHPQPNPGVLNWAGQVVELSLSVITLEEIQFGLAWKPNHRIQSWFDRFFAEQCRVLPITEDVALRAGALRGQLRARGETRTQADMLIAATALANRLTLVTRNTNDFENCGVTVLNPFS
ncbi:MAG TPA: type II toxin-antitoxin system VapC family toxin [Acidobacteriota bacterium]